MKVSSKNWEDVKKYYLGTYVKFDETGDEIWMVSDVSSKRMLLKNSQGEKAGINLEIEDQYTISYAIPPRAVFQKGEHAYSLIRIPARQYYRGMHPENTAFMVFNSLGQWKPLHMDFQTINGFVNKPVYITPALMKEQYKNQPGYQSWAISPYFAVSRLGVISTASGTVVGHIHFDQDIVTANKLFQPELEKLGLFNVFKLMKAKPRAKKEPTVVMKAPQFGAIQALDDPI